MEQIVKILSLALHFDFDFLFLTRLQKRAIATSFRFLFFLSREDFSTQLKKKKILSLNYCNSQVSTTFTALEYALFQHIKLKLKENLLL